ncbi:MAG TPA: helix-turn-helix domain-containing protein [Candidatus Acidoferrum sp.]|nr:helix-turn-helix domain-containing protein [Candidatus Acidoferrum sp.]
MAARAAAAPIPQYALYGDATPSHQVELVHIEDIHERSSRNGWVIKPHRHTHLFQVLVMQSGEMEVRLDAGQQRLRGSWLVTMPTGVVHGFRFRPDTQGSVLSIAVTMQGMDAENQIGRLLDGVLARPLVIKLGARAPLLRQLRHQLQALREELSARQEDQVLVLFAQVKLLLVALRRAAGERSRLRDDSGAGLALADKLKHLVEQRYKDHWGIADYAGALHVSVSTLNRACRDAIGCTAKKLLQDRLHVEAKRRLIYTRETLDQVADSLGYKDTAYFARVFKSLEGTAPNEFRKSWHSLA